MIYMVEHTIGMPEIENEWNAWCTGYMKVLINVPGIHTTQRFKISASSPSKYMSMHTIASAGVFDSAAYKASGGGGNASARFRPAYQSWTRNLFEAANSAPGVPMDRVLVTVDRATPGQAPFVWLTTVGLHQTTPFRGLAVLCADEARRVAGSRQGDANIYTPMYPQLSAAQL